MKNLSSSRDENEVARSASEAKKIIIRPVQLQRYLNPPVNTPFPLEYAFYLLGDARGQTVLDLGCGSGEELIPLLNRGSRVIGIDISPDLIAIANYRLNQAGLDARVVVGSAYETGLPDASVDVIFCMSLIHHLDLRLAREEMLRILRPGGFIVLKEPIRFSETYNFLRGLLSRRDDVSDYEHPLTEDEFRVFREGFECDGLRLFRLPFVPLVQWIIPAAESFALRFSNAIVRMFPPIAHYATVAVIRLRKP
jgi:SAM-dependent methyltransferase